MFVCMYVCMFVYVCKYVCMHACMHACMHVCLYASDVCMYYMFVCMFVCWIYPPGRASFDTLVVHGKKRNLSAEVPIEKINSVPPTLLPLQAKTYATLISFYNFFLQFSDLTSLLIKSLTRYMLLYICNKYKTPTTNEN